MSIFDSLTAVLTGARRCAGIWLAWIACLEIAVAQVPGITSFVPASGPPGTPVTINGSGFSTTTQLRFNDALADFTALSANQLVAFVPVAATSGRLFASNPSGVGNSTANFTVPPRIEMFSPPLGAPGTPVIITGANFTNATAVRFNGTAAIFSVTAEKQISATVPTGATDGPITVVTTVGSADSVTNFLASSRPVVTDVVPLAAAPGNIVTVYGANFSGASTVRFNGVAATSVTLTGQGTQLSVVVPANATTGPLTVTTTGGIATNAQTFVTGTKPIVTDFFPLLGAVGDAVVIHGLNFLGGTTVVKFNGVAAAYSALAANSIQAFVPAGATTGPLSVTTSTGTGTSVTNFITGAGPIITGFAPVAGSAGAPILISGLNLAAGGLVVKFNGVTDATAVATAPGQVVARVPNGATTGPLSVTTTAGGATTTSNFFVTGSAPFLLGFTPTNGPRGTSITITGINFTIATGVLFNGVPAAGAAVTADSQLRVDVPPGALTGPISITSPSGTGTSGVPFYAPPRLTAFAPASGVVGTVFSITGTNFTAATSLTFASTNATRIVAPFTLNSASQLTATVPTNAVTGPLVLTTPGGVIYSAGSFAVLPRLDNFAPTLGPAGTAVVLQGQNFSSATAVRFNGTAAAFTIDSPAQLTATVPAGATTGTLQVANADGTTTSTATFLVTRPTDLVITTSNAPPVFLQNQPATLYITITNRGPSTVTGVTVQDTFPAGMQFVSATSTVGTCSFSGGRLTCSLGVFSNAASATITLTVFNTPAGVAFHQVSVAALEGDTHSADNLSQSLIAVLSTAQRTLSARTLSDSSNVEITWPLVLAPVTLLLQSTTNLANPLQWLDVPPPPGFVTNNAVVYHSLTQDASGSPRFFRLKTP